MSCDPNFVFSIDGHNMTIIEAEGENTEPLLIDSVQIFAAQRYSFVVRIHFSLSCARRCHTNPNLI